MHYKYYYNYSREQLFANEEKCESAPPIIDSVRSVTYVCPMHTHTHIHKHTQMHTGMFEGSYEIKQKILQCLI